MAGIPASVINRSYKILSQLSKESVSIDSNSSNEAIEIKADSNTKIIDNLKNIDVGNITPLEALIKLNEIVDEIDKQ